MAAIRCSECGAGIRIPEERLRVRFAFKCPRCGARQHHEPEPGDPSEDVWSILDKESAYAAPVSSKRARKRASHGSGLHFPLKSALIAGGVCLALGSVAVAVFAFRPTGEEAPVATGTPLPPAGDGRRESDDVVTVSTPDAGLGPDAGTSPPVEGEPPVAAREDMTALQRLLLDADTLLTDLRSGGTTHAPGFGSAHWHGTSVLRIDRMRIFLETSRSGRVGQPGSGFDSDDGHLRLSITISDSAPANSDPNGLFTLVDHLGNEYKSVAESSVVLGKPTELDYVCPRSRAYTLRVDFANNDDDRFWIVKPDLDLDPADMTAAQKARTEFVDRCLEEGYVERSRDPARFDTPAETWQALTDPERELLIRILWGYTRDRRADDSRVAVYVDSRCVGQCIASLDRVELRFMPPVTGSELDDQLAEVEKAAVLLPSYVQGRAYVNEAWFNLDAATRRRYTTAIAARALERHSITDESRIEVFFWSGPAAVEIAHWTPAEGVWMLDDSEAYEEGLDALQRIPDLEQAGLIKEVRWNTLYGAQAFVDAGVWNGLSLDERGNVGRLLSRAALVKQHGRDTVLVRTDGAGDVCEHVLARVSGGETESVTWDGMSWGVATQPIATATEPERRILSGLQPAGKVQLGLYIDDGIMVDVDGAWWQSLTEDDARARMVDWLAAGKLDGDIYSALFVCEASSSVLYAYMTARSHQAIFWNHPKAGEPAGETGAESDTSVGADEYPDLLRSGVVRGVSGGECHVDFSRWKAATPEQRRAWERAIVAHGAQVYGDGVRSLRAWPYSYNCSIFGYDSGDRETDAVVMGDEMPGELLQKYGQNGVLHSYDAGRQLLTVDFHKWLKTPPDDRVEMLKQFARGKTVRLQFVPPIGYPPAPGGDGLPSQAPRPFVLKQDEVARARDEYEDAKNRGRLVYADFGWTSYVHLDITTGGTMNRSDLDALMRALYIVALDKGAGPVMYVGLGRHCNTFKIAWDLGGFKFASPMGMRSPGGSMHSISSRRMFLWLREQGIVRNMLNQAACIDERLWYMLTDEQKEGLGWACCVAAAMEGAAFPGGVYGMMTGRQLYPLPKDVADAGAHEATAAPYRVIGPPDRIGKRQPGTR